MPVIMRTKLLSLIFSITFSPLFSQTVDYSVTSVPEEMGIELTKITNDNDFVCLPEVKRTRNSFGWFTNRIIDVSIDGSQLAYLSYRNNSSNIFIKDLANINNSAQRTNRQMILDFSYSPDGNNIVFAEKRGNDVQVFSTDAKKGYVCRQITSGAQDYSPVYSSDLMKVFFSRQEKNGISIWSYDMTNNYLSTYTSGLNPCPIPNSSCFLCARSNANGKMEIWKIDYSSGTEECIISSASQSFSSPLLSPDGNWILMVGESVIKTDDFSYSNTDIYVCKIDGSHLSQLTFHAADDLSPTWSLDGKFIYFISQRGSLTGTANIWRMTFNHQ